MARRNGRRREEYNGSKHNLTQIISIIIILVLKNASSFFFFFLIIKYKATQGNLRKKVKNPPTISPPRVTFGWIFYSFSF